MTKKLYEHLISTNYAGIKENIKEITKKKKTSKVSRKTDMASKV